jgi:hypothetical protein
MHLHYQYAGLFCGEKVITEMSSFAALADYSTTRKHPSPAIESPSCGKVKHTIGKKFRAKPQG